MPQRNLVPAHVEPDLRVGSAMCVGSNPQAFRIGASGHAAYIHEE